MFRTTRNNRPEPAAGEPAAPNATQPQQQTQTPAAPPAHAATPAAPAVAPPQSAPPRAAQTSSPALATPSTPRAVTETDALARDLKEGLVGGYVGLHSAVSGEANFKGMLRVDGRVSGRINSQDGTLIVSAGGQVDADIEVAVAKINGTVKGDIRARERIEFGRTARVTGNIHTPALVIEQGAIFEGSCRMTEQPPAPQARPRAATATTNAPARNVSAPSAPPAKESKPAPTPAARVVAPPDVPAAPVAREGALV